MDTLTRLFRTSVRWNTAGAIGYQCLLLAHQAALYKLMSPSTYGVMSVLLSLIYFGAILADGGLDATIGTFFHRLTTSRTTFKKTLMPHWLGILVIATTLGLVFSACHTHFFTTITLSPLVVLSAGLILVAESFRRSLRMTLQLAFKAKIVSLLDVSTMFVYLIGVWTAFVNGSQLSLELLMGSLALASVFCTLMMGFFVSKWQQKLSDINLTAFPQRHLISQRLLNGGNALTHQLFSGNVLVPLVSMSSGLANAGLVKLASYLAHGLVTITRKIVGSSGSALLSALKPLPWHAKRPAFWHLSRTLYATIFFSIIVMASMSSHLAAQEVITHYQSSILLLVLLLILSEGLCIAYETLFVIEEKALYVIALNGATGLAAGLLIFSAPTLSLTITLALILGIRLILFGTMALVAARLWQLHPHLPSVNRKLLTRATILICLAYLCGTPLALLLSR